MDLLTGVSYRRLRSAPRPPAAEGYGDASEVQAVPSLVAALVAAHAILAEPHLPGARHDRSDGAVTGGQGRAQGASDPAGAGEGVAGQGASGEAGGPLIVVGWERGAGERRARIVGGLRPAPGDSVPPGPSGPWPFPPGSVSEPLDAAELVGGWRAFPRWYRCLGRPDPLWRPAPGDPRPRGGFDDHVARLDTFVWLVVAEPVPVGTIDRRLVGLESVIPGLRRRESSEAGRVALERAEARYRELARARASGAWWVHVLVGGADPTGARAAAALLCSAHDLAGEPWQLVPDTAATDFPEALAGPDPRPHAPGPWPGTHAPGPAGPDPRPHAPGAAGDEALSSPFLATSQLLAGLARPPRRELPGLRLVEPPHFDVTPEHDEGVALGDVLDAAGRPAGPFRVALGTLNRHGLVAGATGSGKSQTVRHLLEGLHRMGVPWLVIEPAKAEYAAMAGRLRDGRVAVIRPGDPDAVPLGLNPLAPAAGFPLQAHLELVKALFLAAFDAQEPFPQVLAHALGRCYEDLGWDLTLGTPRRPGIRPRYPRLSDLQRSALAVIEGIGYGKEVAANVRGFVDVRLSSLRLGASGHFFEGGYPLDMGDLLRRNVVLEVEDVGSDEDIAFVIGAVLIRLYEHLRVRRDAPPGHGAAQGDGEGSRGGDGGGLRHLTVVEEAHRLLRQAVPGTPAARAVEMWSALLAEVRAYGEGILVAEQVPTKLVPDVVKNTALKVLHRLPAADDRRVVGDTMNLGEAQSRHVVSLPAGRAVAFVDGMDNPVRVAIPLGEHREARAPTGAGHRPPVALEGPPDRWPAALPGGPAGPLALRDLAAAASLAAEPELVLWAELLTVAHIVGKPSPRPGRRWLDELVARAGAHRARHAVALGARAAVERRYAGLTAWYQPEALTEHLVVAALGVMDGGAPCAGDEVSWQAGRYRWVDVVDALRNDPVPPGRPHPDTGAWAARGLDLPGPTVVDQLAQLRDHPDYWRPPRTVVIGSGPAGWWEAVEALAPEGDPSTRFVLASRFLGIDDPWPLPVLGLAEDAPAAEG